MQGERTESRNELVGQGSRKTSVEDQHVDDIVIEENLGKELSNRTAMGAIALQVSEIVADQSQTSANSSMQGDKKQSRKILRTR